MNGIWVLIVMVHTSQYKLDIMPMWLYGDTQFGYAQCQLDKEQFNKTTVQKYRFECVRQGEA